MPTRVCRFYTLTELAAALALGHTVHSGSHSSQEECETACVADASTGTGTGTTGTGTGTGEPCELRWYCIDGPGTGTDSSPQWYCITGPTCPSTCMLITAEAAVTLTDLGFGVIGPFESQTACDEACPSTGTGSSSGTGTTGSGTSTGTGTGSSTTGTGTGSGTGTGTGSQHTANGTPYYIGIQGGIPDGTCDCSTMANFLSPVSEVSVNTWESDDVIGGACFATTKLRIQFTAPNVWTVTFVQDEEVFATYYYDGWMIFAQVSCAFVSGDDKCTWPVDDIVLYFVSE